METAKERRFEFADTDLKRLVAFSIELEKWLTNVKDKIDSRVWRSLAAAFPQLVGAAVSSSYFGSEYDAFGEEYRKAAKQFRDDFGNFGRAAKQCAYQLSGIESEMSWVECVTNTIRRKCLLARVRKQPKTFELICELADKYASCHALAEKAYERASSLTTSLERLSAVTLPKLPPPPGDWTRDEQRDSTSPANPNSSRELPAQRGLPAPDEQGKGIAKSAPVPGRTSIEIEFVGIRFEFAQQLDESTSRRTSRETSTNSWPRGGPWFLCSQPLATNTIDKKSGPHEYGRDDSPENRAVWHRFPMTPSPPLSHLVTDPLFFEAALSEVAADAGSGDISAYGVGHHDLVSIKSVVTIYSWSEMTALGQQVIEKSIDDTLPVDHRQAIGFERWVSNPKLLASGIDGVARPHYFIVKGDPSTLSAKGISSAKLTFYNSANTPFKRRSVSYDDNTSFAYWDTLHSAAQFAFDNSFAFDSDSTFVLEINVLNTTRCPMPPGLRRQVLRERSWALMNPVQRRYVEYQHRKRAAARREAIGKLASPFGANDSDEWVSDSMFIRLTYSVADDLQGTVTKGAFRGKHLSALSLTELLRLRSACRVDPNSLKSCELFLDRHWPDWTSDGKIDFDARDDDMSLDEAYAILGVTPSDNDDAIRRAFRARVKETHPDATQKTEGSGFRQVNKAMDVIRSHRQMS